MRNWRFLSSSAEGVEKARVTPMDYSESRCVKNLDHSHLDPTRIRVGSDRSVVPERRDWVHLRRVSGGIKRRDDRHADGEHEDRHADPAREGEDRA